MVRVNDGIFQVNDGIFQGVTDVCFHVAGVAGNEVDVIFVFTEVDDESSKLVHVRGS